MGEPEHAERPEHVDVVIVDVANVLGSRPDGWWRDRRGATTALLRRLAATDVGAERVVVVLEGQGRDADAPRDLEVVRAAGSGDDALVARVARELSAGRLVRVVTADRGLRARLPQAVQVTGPAWLRDRMDQAHPS